MPNTNNELLPLLPQVNTSTPSFFHRSLQALKKTSIFTAGLFSGYMYWPTSFQAAKFGGESLQYIAALGGSITNSIFNIESFLHLAEAPNFRKMPVKYLTAALVSFFCVLPIFLMNIKDEKGQYIDNTAITFQGLIASLNILVNIVGTLELIDSISGLYTNKTKRKKNEVMGKIDTVLLSFSYLNPEEQTKINFLRLIENNFQPLSLKQQISHFSLKASLGVISIPLILAYTLISYFDMKEFAERELQAAPPEGILFGILAAIGNTIPSIGFLIKGLNSSCAKLISLERPSPLFWVFILPVSFSGFTTHQAMEDSLKTLNYSGNFAEALKWISNSTAAFLYNLPQIASLADRLSRKKNSIPNAFYLFQSSLYEYIQPMDTNQFESFIEAAPSNITQRASNFFQLRSNTIQDPSIRDIESQQITESSFSL